MRIPILVIAVFSLLISHGLVYGDEPSTVRLATTTSTQNSGLLDDLLPRFEALGKFRIHVIAVGTGKALRLGEAGDVDMVMVHAPDLELKYLNAGAYVDRRPLMYNRFVLVGPPANPAQLSPSMKIVASLNRIQAGAHRFISRGDRSGTHHRELMLWKAAGILAQGAWYQEVGQGMGQTLVVADQREAYTLSDEATYLAFKRRLSLKVFSGDESILMNPYAVMAVSPKKHPHVNTKGVRALMDWLTGPNGQQAIAAYRRGGRQLFFPGTPSD